jgi:hypothetical protein
MFISGKNVLICTSFEHLTNLTASIFSTQFKVKLVNILDIYYNVYNTKIGLLPKGQFWVAVSAFAFQAQFNFFLAFSQIYF